MSEINYSSTDWCLNISEMSKAEWDQLVSICRSKGITLFNEDYTSRYNHLRCSHNMCLERYTCKGTNREVSILEMLNILETPLKSKNQLRIDELQKTIDSATKQIKYLQDSLC